MKVFLAGTSFRAEYGGPAVTVSSLAHALASAKVDVGLWAPDGSAADSTIISPPHGFRRLGGNLASALNAFGRPDIIHDNGVWMPHNYALARYARKSKVARLVSTRGMLEPWALSHKYWKKIAPWLIYQKSDLARANCLHATSSSEAANLGKLFPSQWIEYLPNGVDLTTSEIRHSNENQRRVALFVGRIHPVKGIPLLLKAWAHVRPLGWILKIAGPDEANHLLEVRELIRNTGIGDAVQLIGPLTLVEKRAAYATADLFILPSHSESFGLVIAEALAAGCPVITTTSVPWPSIDEEKLGWRVASTVEGITAALSEATRCSRDTLQAMGHRGQHYVREKFGWDYLGAKYLTIYREILKT